MWSNFTHFLFKSLAVSAFTHTHVKHLQGPLSQALLLRTEGSIFTHTHWAFPESVFTHTCTECFQGPLSHTLVLRLGKISFHTNSFWAFVGATFTYTHVNHLCRVMFSYLTWVFARFTQTYMKHLSGLHSYTLFDHLQGLNYFGFSVMWLSNNRMNHEKLLSLP